MNGRAPKLTYVIGYYFGHVAYSISYECVYFLSFCKYLGNGSLFLWAIGPFNVRPNLDCFWASKYLASTSKSKELEILYLQGVGVLGHQNSLLLTPFPPMIFFTTCELGDPTSDFIVDSKNLMFTLKGEIFMLVI